MNIDGIKTEINKLNAYICANIKENKTREYILDKIEDINYCIKEFEDNIRLLIE